MLYYRGEGGISTPLNKEEPRRLGLSRFNHGNWTLLILCSTQYRSGASSDRCTNRPTRDNCSSCIIDREITVHGTFKAYTSCRNVCRRPVLYFILLFEFVSSDRYSITYYSFSTSRNRQGNRLYHRLKSCLHFHESEGSADSFVFISDNAALARPERLELNAL